MASNSKFIAELLDSSGDVNVSNLDNLGTAATNDTGDFLQVSNDLSDLNDAATARTNLGLGLVATLDVAGGAQDFVATGTIATGDVVGLRSDGTVEVIPAHSSSADVTNLNFSTQYVLDYVYHKVLERFVVFYRGYNSGYYYYYTIGKIVNNTISFSTPVDLLSNASIGQYGITAIQSLKAEVEYYKNTIIVTGTFTKSGNPSCGILIGEIDTVNDVLTGTFDSAAYGYTEILASTVSDVKPIVLSGHGNVNFGDNYRFSTLYKTSSNGYLYHRAATVNAGSGTQSVVLGSTTAIVSNNVSNVDGVHDQNNDKIIVFYTYNSSSDKNLYSTAGTITYNGTLTTNFTSQVTAFTNPYSTFTSNSTLYFLGRPIYDTTQSKTLLLIDLYNSSTYKTYRYGIVSNYTTNVNILSSNLISTDYVNTNSSIRYKMLHFSSTTGEFMFGINSKTSYATTNQDNDAHFTIFFGKIINNNFVITKTYKDYTPSIFLTQNKTYFHATGDYGYILLHNGDEVAGLKTLSFCSHTNNIDKLMNIVGISNENITNGNTGSIAISGGYNTELTGLVAGNKYYLQGDGTIGLNSLSKNLLGTAVSSTKLFLQQNIK